MDVVPRLTARALAQACQWHESKVSKIENGKQSVTDDDIRAWCKVCGAEDEIATLVTMRRQADRSYVEWRRALRSGLTQHQGTYMPQWSKIRRFRIYESGVIPGFLQTAEYAKAIFTAAARFYQLASDPGEAAAARIQRAHLLDSDRIFAFIVEESALRSWLGQRDVMRHQLRHLLHMSRRPNISLGVIPLGIDRTFLPTEGFWIYDDTEALVETVSAQLNIAAPHEVELYVRAFAELAGMAQQGAAARDLIADALTTLQ